MTNVIASSTPTSSASIKLLVLIFCFDEKDNTPGPDMHVRGLRKYLNAASHLFNHAKSDAELLSLDVVSDSKIVARRKLRGVLHLPWHP